MPLATARREYATLIQPGRDGAHASNAPSAEVIYDGLEVCRTVLGVRLHSSQGLCVTDLLSPKRRAPLGLPSFTPRALAAARAALVRSLISGAIRTWSHGKGR
jgi:hypothetical protein